MLQNLAPELLIHILASIDELKDLWTVLSSVPDAWHVFQQRRAYISCAVLKNGLGPFVLHQALAVVNVPTWRDIVPYNEKMLVKKSRAFVENYWGGSFSTKIDADKVAEMTTLHRKTEILISDYVLRCFNALELPEDQRRPLSSIERMRLFRTFYQYEVYCRLFKIEYDCWGGNVFSSQVQWEWFVFRMPPYDAESVCCVHQYYTTLIGEYMDELEDDLVNAVMSIPEAEIPPYVVEYHSRRERKPLDYTFSREFQDVEREIYDVQHRARSDTVPPPIPEAMVPFECVTMSSLTIYSISGRIRSANFLSYMSSLGIGFIHGLMFGDSAHRRNAIRNNTPIWRDFLPEALDWCEIDPQGNASLAKHKTAPHRSELGPNLGYKLLRRSIRDLYLCILGRGQMNSGMRDRGYVFWDNQRICSAPVTEALKEARILNSEQIERSYGRFNARSPERRLRGVRLPWKCLKNIADRFGSNPDNWVSEDSLERSLSRVDWFFE